jgi:uncharacterized protein HemX
MKSIRLLVPLAAAALLGASAAMAAAVESVESARASAAFQKLDAFLSEKLVAEQLAQLGVSPAQARARLAELSEAQLQTLAAQVDTLQAGGTIQGGKPHPLGPLGCVLAQIRDTVRHVVRFLFCWNDVR